MSDADRESDLILSEHPDWIAYHEAGHAVADVLVRNPITRASIIADEERGSLGHVANRPYGESFKIDVETTLSLRARERLEARIMSALAGDEALRRYLGKDAPTGWLGADGDYRAAVDLAEHVSPEPKELGAFLEWLGIRAANLFYLPWHWAAVEAIAAALLEHKVLSGPRVRQIVQRAIHTFHEEERRTGVHWQPPQCEGETDYPGAICGDRPLAGSRFCDRHQPKEA